MLHILLLILKITGIILAAILGILVLLILLVLFVPVRYEALGKCAGELSTLKGKIKVTWFWHLIRADVYYREKKLKWRLRIAWKKILGGESFGEETRADGSSVPEAREETAGEKKAEPADEETAGGERTVAEPAGEKKAEPADERAAEEKKTEGHTGKERENEQDGGYGPYFQEEFQEGSESEETAERIRKASDILEEAEPAVEEADEARGETTGGKRAEAGEETPGRFERIKYTIRNFCDRIKELKEKKDRIMEFIRDEAHVGAFRRVKREAFRLLGKLKPRHFAVQARFGTGDPFRTGQILAVLAAAYPFLGNDLSMEPDFERKLLKGNLSTKGHIRFCHFLASAGRLLIAGDVRRTYKDIRNFEL